MSVNPKSVATEYLLRKQSLPKDGKLDLCEWGAPVRIALSEGPKVAPSWIHPGVFERGAWRVRVIWIALRAAF